MIIKNGLVIINNELVKKDILIKDNLILDIADNIDITDVFGDVKCEWNYKILDYNFKEVLDESLMSDVSSILDKYQDRDIERCRFKNKFKFNGDEQYINYRIKVTCKLKDMSTTALLDIVPL